MTYQEGYDLINNKYDKLKEEIEAKEITENEEEEYTEENKQAELTANEEARNEELEANKANKEEEIKPLNETYLLTMTTIATAITELKTDKETKYESKA